MESLYETGQDLLDNSKVNIMRYDDRNNMRNALSTPIHVKRTKGPIDLKVNLCNFPSLFMPLFWIRFLLIGFENIYQIIVEMKKKKNICTK